MLCTDTEQVKTIYEFHASMGTNGAIGIYLPFECTDLGDDYYNNGGANCIEFSIGGLIDEFIDEACAVESGDDLAKIANLLHEKSMIIKNKIKAAQLNQEIQNDKPRSTTQSNGTKE